MDYTFLPTVSNADEQPVGRIEPKDVFKRLHFWSCVVAICSSLVSASILILGRPSHLEQHNALLPSQRASTYIGLEKVDFSRGPVFSPITSFAHIVLQINSKDHRRNMLEDHKSYDTLEGVVFPNDRHLLVSGKISTIIQFRHLDYGMERCFLHVSVPSSRDTVISPSDGATIDVWKLDSSKEISRFVELSWTSAPPRQKLHGTVLLHDNVTIALSEFACSSGGFSTFELSCSSSEPDCLVDFWQAKQSPPTGVYLAQLTSESIR